MSTRKKTDVQCISCGTWFIADPRRKYCAECAGAVHREIVAKARATKREERKQNCAYCGKIFYTKAYNGKYCSTACSAAAKKEQRRQEQRARREEKRRRETQLSPLGQIVEAARAAGLSYGQYVARTEGPMAAYLRQTEKTARAAERKKK